MPFRIACTTALLMCCLANLSFADDLWNEKKGEHFLIYYQSDSSFAERVLEQAEEVYERETGYFGSISGKNFWLWDNRCKLFLYNSQHAYLNATGQPEWSSGYADVGERAIVSYERAPEFLDTVLPHEMAHLIFREFVEVGNRSVPRWLDEGFAISQEKNVRDYLDETIKKAVHQQGSIPLEELNRAGALHGAPANQARLFYAEAQSLARFLIEGRDGSHFLNFCRSLRDNASFEEALVKGYQNEFSSIDTLEKKWKKFVMAS